MIVPFQLLEWNKNCKEQFLADAEWQPRRSYDISFTWSGTTLCFLIDGEVRISLPFAGRGALSLHRMIPAQVGGCSRFWNQGRSLRICSSCPAGARRRQHFISSLPAGAPQRISTPSLGL